MEEIDHSRPWGLFDGVIDHDQGHYSCGISLFLVDFHQVMIKMGLGLSTNNFSELVTLKVLLQSALEK